MTYLRWAKINHFLETVTRVNKDIYIFPIVILLIKKYSRENIYIKLRAR